MHGPWLSHSQCKKIQCSQARFLPAVGVQGLSHYDDSTRDLGLKNRRAVYRTFETYSCGVAGEMKTAMGYF